MAAPVVDVDATPGLMGVKSEIAAGQNRRGSGAAPLSAAFFSPTPLRQRRERAASPATSALQRRPSEAGGRPTAASTAASARRASVSSAPSPWWHHLCTWRGLGVAVLCEASLLLMAMLVTTAYDESAGSADARSWGGVGSTWSAEVAVPWQSRPAEHGIEQALTCPGVRADILDVLVGAPLELAAHGVKGEALKLATHAAHIATAAGASAGSTPRDVSVERELQQAVTQLSSKTYTGWPPVLKRRLLDAVGTRCEEWRRCTSGPVAAAARDTLPTAAGPGLKSWKLEVDQDFTSQGATTVGSGWLHQAFLRVGAATGLQRWKAHASLHRSKPASVIVQADAALTIRDCFAARPNASVALHLPGTSIVRQLVIEQPPRWMTPRPGSSPRRFSVYASPSASSGGQDRGPQGPYTMFLATFEYSMAAPAVQAFELPMALVAGLRITFEDSWGMPYMCLYRVRALDTLAPSCSGGRLARIAASAP